MALRVTREYADVLGAGEGEVRVTRQYVEMLTSGYPKVRVARQYVEVLASLPDDVVHVTRQCVAVLGDKPIPTSEDALILIDEATGRITLNLSYYGTLAEAIEYFDSRLYEWAWSAASSGDKERALIEARCLMDGLCYKGYKHTVYEVMEQWAESTEIDDDKLAEIRAAEKTQLNEFPRGADVEIPEDILIAQYEIAHSLLDNKDPQLELELLAVTSATYGGVKTVYQRDQFPLEHLINLIPNAVAWRRLRPYLRDGDAIKLSRVS